ncbi:hypothetical protein DRO91_05560 [Candidatus Heimdallarchaeota archaeon]|nr:MAG: hypothetical protein DRO91_05560 [Candidatus Heimdallarchaeota archaeon]
MNNFMKTFTHKVNLEKLTKKELIEMIENRKRNEDSYIGKKIASLQGQLRFAEKIISLLISKKPLHVTDTLRF